jgi:hypothetical protein
MRPPTRVRASTGVRWSSAGLPTSRYRRDHISHSCVNAGETRSARPSHPALRLSRSVSRSAQICFGCRRRRIEFCSLVGREFLD